MTFLLRMTTIVAALLIGALSPAYAADKSWPIDHVLGKADAPITIIEYASLGCPHCADFNAETLPQFKTDWLDTGKAKLIYRDFPLDGRSLAAAMVAQCSGDRYFAFLDAFYGTQGTWGSAPDGLSAIKNIAKLGGLSETQVDTCLANKELMNQIYARKQAASKEDGIDSTPAFLVNGKSHSGFLSYEELVNLLR